MKVRIIPLVIGALGTVTKRLVQRLEDLEITRRVDCPNYNIVEIGQTTEKSPGDLRLAATQIPVENHPEKNNNPKLSGTLRQKKSPNPGQKKRPQSNKHEGTNMSASGLYHSSRSQRQNKGKWKTR